jgi:ATP-dependent Clp protease, protease subunit
MDATRSGRPGHHNAALIKTSPAVPAGAVPAGMSEPPSHGTAPPGVGQPGWAPFPPAWLDRPVDPMERLLRRRLVTLSGEISTDSANELMAKLLWLDSEAPGSPIELRINSPGGEVLAGLGIIDTMQGLTSPVHATCVGVGASMASVILACATPGQRRATPNARILIHQPWSGQFQGKAADLERAAEEVLRLRARIDTLLADATGQPVDRIHRDTDRDTWFSAEEARAYGLIDHVGSPAAQAAAAGSQPGERPAGGNGTGDGSGRPAGGERDSAGGAGAAGEGSTDAGGEGHER